MEPIRIATVAVGLHVQEGTLMLLLQGRVANDPNVADQEFRELIPMETGWIEYERRYAAAAQRNPDLDPQLRHEVTARTWLAEILEEQRRQENVRALSSAGGKRRR